MDYRYLKVFIEAANSLNFAKTATRLGIAASAVTRQIQLFEDSVGEPLFIRNNRKVILTEKGQEILNLSEPLERWTTAQGRSLVRIAGLTAALEHYFWPKLSPSLIESVDLDIVEKTSTEALNLLLQGNIDMALVNRKEESAQINYLSLASESFVLISKQKIALSQIEQYRWIYGDSGDLLKQVSGSKKTQKFIKVSSIYQIYDLVEKGVGIAIVPKTPLLEKRKFHSQDISTKKKNLYLAIPASNKLPKATQAVIDSLIH